MTCGSASGPDAAYSALVLIAFMIVSRNGNSVARRPITTRPSTCQRPIPRCRRPCMAAVLCPEPAATSRTASAIALLRRLLLRLDAQEHCRQRPRQDHLHNRDRGGVAHALRGEEVFVGEV